MGELSSFICSAVDGVLSVLRETSREVSWQFVFQLLVLSDALLPADSTGCIVCCSGQAVWR